MRIRQGFAMPDLDNPLVRRKTREYAANSEYLQRMLERSRIYLHHIVEEIEKRGLPTELALLPMVESAFNPMAYSRAHASGIWQFVPGTGKRFDLKQNSYYDGRRDIVDSTGAALDYLTGLHATLRRLAPRARILQLGRERRGPRGGARTARPASRSTTPACACPRRRATTCPSCRR